MAREEKAIAAILLAAGAGTRFGGDKLLHPLEDGVAIAAHAARNLLAVTPDVVAVVRWGDFPLYDMLEQEGCQVTMFQGAARGMGASLAHAVAQAGVEVSVTVGFLESERLFQTMSGEVSGKTIWQPAALSARKRYCLPVGIVMVTVAGVGIAAALMQAAQIRESYQQQMIGWLKSMGASPTKRNAGVQTAPVKKMRSLKDAALEKAFREGKSSSYETMSSGPPGAVGTMSRIGLVG